MDKLKSAIYGLAVGDALGVPFEFRERGTFRCEGMTGYGTWNRAPGTWSDDTSMTLATLDSIKEVGRIDPLDMKERFCDWLRKGKYTADGDTFDVGTTTRMALDRGNGLDDYYSNGNGSLMRILPLAFTDATDDEIRAVSAITHAHKISTDACVEYVHLARKLIEGKPIIREEIKNKSMDEIKSSGFVLHTLEASIWCLLNTSSYKEAVLTAVNLGEDTDTTAAVVGGLAGIVYGYDSIPGDWIEELKNKELIDAILKK
ncbi:ADP-ribosylglycohydrolase family protein [Aedoeadaptatus pacaensis]|uniref:ADP-ribosylglycohydrolase family protein n=1 Tax=Aedoeadaptatus pacaensis TaxID=1776390 RepID=UPI000837FECD|nr:ADP-ribosylglycohydrolase family protein [Peptoniphilus pacaensis]